MALKRITTKDGEVYFADSITGKRVRTNQDIIKPASQLLFKQNLAASSVQEKPPLTKADALSVDTLETDSIDISVKDYSNELSKCSEENQKLAKELLYQRDVLQQELCNLEQPRRELNHKIWTTICFGGFFFLLFGIAGASSKEPGGFGFLSMMVFVITYFVLQNITRNSPAQKAVKINLKIADIKNRLYFLGALSEPENENVIKTAIKENRITLVFIGGFTILFLIGAIGSFMNKEPYWWLMFLLASFTSIMGLFSLMIARTKFCKLGLNCELKQTIRILFKGRVS